MPTDLTMDTYIPSNSHFQEVNVTASLELRLLKLYIYEEILENAIKLTWFMFLSKLRDRKSGPQTYRITATNKAFNKRIESAQKPCNHASSVQEIKHFKEGHLHNMQQKNFRY